MRILVDVFLLLLVTGCLGAGKVVDSATADRIPEGANLVRIQVSSSRAEAEEALLREFAKRGIAVRDEEASAWTTQPLNIGQGTVLSMTISFLERDQAITVLMRGRWGLTSSMAAATSALANTGGAGGRATNEADWTTGRPERAYGVMADIATSTFPEDTVSFQVD